MQIIAKFYYLRRYIRDVILEREKQRKEKEKMKQQKEQRDRDRDRDGDAGRQKTLDTDNGELMPQKKPRKKKEILSSESDSIEGGGVDAEDIARARLNDKTTVKSELLLIN